MPSGRGWPVRPGRRPHAPARGCPAWLGPGRPRRWHCWMRASTGAVGAVPGVNRLARRPGSPWPTGRSWRRPAPARTPAPPRPGLSPTVVSVAAAASRFGSPGAAGEFALPPIPSPASWPVFCQSDRSGSGNSLAAGGLRTAPASSRAAGPTGADPSPGSRVRTDHVRAVRPLLTAGRRTPAGVGAAGPTACRYDRLGLGGMEPMSSRIGPAKAAWAVGSARAEPRPPAGSAASPGLPSPARTRASATPVSGAFGSSCLQAVQRLAAGRHRLACPPAP